MSKIQLKNVSNMNQGIPAGPLDGKLNMREAGALNESGMLDDSGLIDDSGLWDVNAGYTYHIVEIGSAIYVRYLISWTDGNYSGCDLTLGRIQLDEPGVNPYATGCLDDPIVNSDTDHYQLVHQQVNSCVVIHRTIDGSATIEYIHYPKGRTHTDEQGGEPKTYYKSEIITYTVPEPDEE